MTTRNRHRKPKQKQSALQIRDIARMADVSPQTISRYFKDPQSVKPANRERIAKIVTETGYFPNPVARSLSSNRSHVVAAIVPTIDHSIFSEMMAGLSDTLEEQGYALLIASNRYSLEKEEELVRRFLAQRVAGLVLVGQYHTEGTRTLLQASGTPVVEVLEAKSEPIDCCVGFSNYAASYDITSRLIGCGITTIAFISAPLAGNDRVQKRFDGYRHALETAGLAFDDALVATAEFSIKNGTRVFADMIARRPDLRAVVSNDILGVGILLHCLRSGISVPDEVSITGFDDLEMASMFTPELTTVRIKGYETGVIAAETILSRQSGAPAEQKIRDLGYEIAWRGSTPPGCAKPG